MQTFNLDISAKRVIPLLSAKQRDVGSKICIKLTDNEEDYVVPDDVTWSVWYSGVSGEGNYDKIDGRDAVVVNGSTATVELIYQMLDNPGQGEMCLVMNSADGTQLGLWNIPYFVEAIPGANSKAAIAYYQAFLQAQEKSKAAAGRAEVAAEDAKAAAKEAADKKPQDVIVTASFDTVVNDTISTGAAGTSAYDVATAISKGATVTLIDDDNRVYKYCGYRLEPNYSNAFFEAQEIDANGITTYRATINNEGQASRTKYTHEYATAATDPDRHAGYFTITDDGVISLKDEYRAEGSKNKELPAHLVIPEIVNGIVVNSLAEGMFSNNTALEYVTLPRTIKKIPDRCFFYACRLKEIFGTENITALGERALNRASSLIRANFPNLTSMKLMSLQGCPSLVYADVGRIQTVSEYSFACNINMQGLKNAGNVTGIDPTAFYKCARLKHFENLEKLSTIGATGLWGSGIPYTEQAKLADRTLGTYAIAPQVNPTDFWSECTYTPCENPLPTYLAQNNPLWENRAVGSKTYISACMLFDVVHAYCGLHNITLSDVDDLEAMVNDIDPALLTNYVGTYTYQTVLAKGIGLNVESYGTVDKTVLQTLYDALAAGKYASVTISSGNNGSVKGHCALIYGVTATGELMLCDCNSVWWHDFTKPYLYTLPIQNIMAHSISGRNTILEIYSV